MSFCNVPFTKVDNPAIVNIDLLSDKAQKPDLICIYCTRIKSFKSTVALWGHLVHKHEHKPGRLQEIVWSANLWHGYWASGNGAKRGDPTMAKLDQSLQEDFTWQTILDWNLRQVGVKLVFRKHRCLLGC